MRIAQVARVPMPPVVAVVDALGAAACDARAIAAGIPSRALMQRAGAAAAALLVEQFADRIAQGVVIATGPGNNGGDGWVVAHALYAAGVSVRVVECMPPRTADAQAERTEAIAAGVHATSDLAALLAGGERLVVDALLGTGLSADGTLRGAIATAVHALQALRARGAAIVALDLPTGIDASTGADAGCAPAELTVTFGTIKRGHLVARGQCGRIVVADIGLGAHGNSAGAAHLATPAWFRAMLPAIAADAHKGTRGKVAIVGGAEGMAGAAMLAARGALRSGAGMVKCVVAPASVAAVQQGEPAALCAPWPTDDASMRRVVGDWADVVLVGPGLGTHEARAMVQRVIAGFDGPIVLDADALNAFADDVPALRALLGAREALLTPHPAEFARLTGASVRDVLNTRFERPALLAAASGAAVLLKGVPTIVASVAGDVRCIAEGTPILATGGSGDILGGMAAALLAQTGDAALAGALAAFAHGRAARTLSARQVRGFTLDDLLHALPAAWLLDVAQPRPPVLADLPAVGEASA